MKMRLIPNLIFTLVTIFIYGCGVGGFSGDSTTGGASGGSSGADNTKISGVVSKGIFKNGTVRVYAFNTDGSETILKTTSILAYGNYSANIGPRNAGPDGSYSGIVLIKASGSYFDEATGSELTIHENEPLRTLIVNPSGDSNRATVTPLTEIAVRKALAARNAGNQVTIRDVMDANSLVSQMFKVDIIATKPVGADASSTGFGNAATTQSQKDYALALAAISQMAKDSGSLSSVLASLETDIADNNMSVETATTIQTALTAFLNSDKNLTGVNNINATNLVNLGGSTKNIKLATTEKLGTGALIAGITVTLQLPPGVTVKADFSTPEKKVKNPLSGVVTASGSGALAGNRVEAAYVPAFDSLPGLVTLSLINAPGVMAGEFVTIQCDMPAGSKFTTADFSIYKNLTDPNDSRNFKAVDGNGAKFPPDIISVQIVPVPE